MARPRTPRPPAAPRPPPRFLHAVFPAASPPFYPQRCPAASPLPRCWFRGEAGVPVSAAGGAGSAPSGGRLAAARCAGPSRLGWVGLGSAGLRPLPPCRYFSPGLAATSRPSPPPAAPGGGGGGSAEPSPRNRNANRDVPVLRGGRAPSCSSSLRLREPLAKPSRAPAADGTAAPALRQPAAS